MVSHVRSSVPNRKLCLIKTEQFNPKWEIVDRLRGFADPNTFYRWYSNLGKEEKKEVVQHIKFIALSEYPQNIFKAFDYVKAIFQNGQGGTKENKSVVTFVCRLAAGSPYSSSETIKEALKILENLGARADQSQVFSTLRTPPRNRANGNA